MPKVSSIGDESPPPDLTLEQRATEHIRHLSLKLIEFAPDEFTEAEQEESADIIRELTSPGSLAALFDMAHDYHEKHPPVIDENPLGRCLYCLEFGHYNEDCPDICQEDDPEGENSGVLWWLWGSLALVGVMMIFGASL